jgi:hypothetical protein
VTKIDAFAHILPPGYAGRLESITSGPDVSGTPLDERRFGAIFDTVTRRDGVLWIHPTRSPVWADYPSEKRSEYGIWWSLGWPYETSACMVRLVYSGCFDRYPGLRLITHHAGAMVPHFLGPPGIAAGGPRPRRHLRPPEGRSHGLLPALLRRHGEDGAGNARRVLRIPS